MRRKQNPQIRSSVNGLCSDDEEGRPQDHNKGPSLKNSKQNWLEMATAGKGAKLILDALGNSKIPIKERKRFSALTGRLRKVIQSDKINNFGERTVSDGNLQLLSGFKYPDKLTQKIEDNAVINSAEGIYQLDIPSFCNLGLPSDTATHYEVTFIAASINFELNSFIAAHTLSGRIPIRKKGKISLSVKLDVKTKQPLFLFLYIHFFTRKEDCCSGKHNEFFILKIKE